MYKITVNPLKINSKAISKVVHLWRAGCRSNWVKARLIHRMGIEPMLLPWKGSVLTTWPTVHVWGYPYLSWVTSFKHLLLDTTSDKFRRPDLNWHLNSEKWYAIFNNDLSRNRTYVLNAHPISAIKSQLEISLCFSADRFDFRDRVL